MGYVPVVFELGEGEVRGFDGEEGYFEGHCCGSLGGWWWEVLDGGVGEWLETRVLLWCGCTRDCAVRTDARYGLEA